MRRHQRQRQSRQNQRQRQLQHRLPTAVRCLVAPGEGFALVPCGRALCCESCVLRVADVNSVFLLMTHCTHDAIATILCQFALLFNTP